MNITRDFYLNQLVAGQGNGLVKIVTGIRRCGKSYLLFKLFHDYLLGKGVQDFLILVLFNDKNSSCESNWLLLIDNCVSEFITHVAISCRRTLKYSSLYSGHVNFWNVTTVSNLLILVLPRDFVSGAIFMRLLATVSFPFIWNMAFISWWVVRASSCTLNVCPCCFAQSARLERTWLRCRHLSKSAEVVLIISCLGCPFEFWLHSTRILRRQL